MGNLRTPYGNCPVIIADEFNPCLGRVEYLVLACDFESGQRRSHRCKLVEVRLELHIGLPALELNLLVNRSVGKQIILSVVVLQGLECESLSYLFLAAWMYGIVCTYVTGGYKAATFNLFGGLRKGNRLYSRSFRSCTVLSARSRTVHQAPRIFP